LDNVLIILAIFPFLPYHKSNITSTSYSHTLTSLICTPQQFILFFSFTSVSFVCWSELVESNPAPLRHFHSDPVMTSCFVKLTCGGMVQSQRMLNEREEGIACSIGTGKSLGRKRRERNEGWWWEEGASLPYNVLLDSIQECFYSSLAFTSPSTRRSIDRTVFPLDVLPSATSIRDAQIGLRSCKSMIAIVGGTTTTNCIRIKIQSRRKGRL
jgi:hypothetical protein